MKRILIATLIIISGQSLFAQAFDKGSKMIGITGSLDGLYLGNLYTGLNVSYDQGFMDVGGPGVISLGGSVGFGRRSYNDNSNYSWSASRTFLAFRGAYHYNGLDEKNFDLYGGLEAGFGIISNRYVGSSFGVLGYNTNTYSNGYLRVNPFIGMRYFFTDKFGVMAETSVALFNGLNAGITFKL